MARHRLTIADLLRQDRLASITPDDDEARQLLEHAEAHLQSAQRVAMEDPAGAYQLIYDAARKAVAADMLANGLRAKDRRGSHAAVVAYAEETPANDVDTEALANFDRMRRSRNRSEYGAMTFGARQIETDRQHAAAIVAGVRHRLGQ